MKRVVAISDTHCGHLLGLTPPKWQVGQIPGHSSMRERAGGVQREMWKWYTTVIDQLKPIDILIHNADAIDGKGDRSGGTEQITTDREAQCEIAAECIRYADPGKVYMTYGTPYHTGKGEDWEAVLVRMLREGGMNATIDNYIWLDVDGTIFHAKHKIGRSSIPHGRHTAIAKERMWNVLEHDHDDTPKANVLLRSHVHYFTFCGGPGWLGMTMPALQAPGTKYGARECTGVIDVGLIEFRVSGNGGIPSWTNYRFQGSSLRANVLQG